MQILLPLILKGFDCLELSTQVGCLGLDFDWLDGACKQVRHSHVDKKQKKLLKMFVLSLSCLSFCSFQFAGLFAWSCLLVHWLPAGCLGRMEKITDKLIVWFTSILPLRLQIPPILTSRILTRLLMFFVFGKYLSSVQSQELFQRLPCSWFRIRCESTLLMLMLSGRLTPKVLGTVCCRYAVEMRNSVRSQLNSRRWLIGDQRLVPWSKVSSTRLDDEHAIVGKKHQLCHCRWCWFCSSIPDWRKDHRSGRFSAFVDKTCSCFVVCYVEDLLQTKVVNKWRSWDFT